MFETIGKVVVFASIAFSTYVITALVATTEGNDTYLFGDTFKVSRRNHTTYGKNEGE